MSDRPVKIVVWDSIGNTLLGVRPWSSWDPGVQAHLLAEDPAGPDRAWSFRDFFAGRDIDLIWFNSADAPYEAFGQLYKDYEDALRFSKDVQEIGAEVADADFLILHKERLPGKYIRLNRNLKLIQHLGLDARGAPLGAADATGVPVAATPLINYITVAEQVWAYILNWSKRLPALREYMKERSYGENWGRFPRTTYLGDLKLGLLGMGEIARPVARAAQAFGMPTVYWDIHRFPDLESEYGMAFAEWDDIFATCDVISVQLALNPKTESIIGVREFGSMKPGALFINTARGKLVDQQALTWAANEQKITIALDVYAEEPLPYDDPLLVLHDNADERVTLTPHNAWQSPWTWVRDSQELWLNVARSLNDEPIKWLIPTGGSSEVEAIEFEPPTGPIAIAWPSILARLEKTNPGAYQALSRMQLTQIDLPDICLAGQPLTPDQRIAVRRVIRTETGESVNLRLVQDELTISFESPPEAGQVETKPAPEQPSVFEPGDRIVQNFIVEVSPPPLLPIKEVLPQATDFIESAIESDVPEPRRRPAPTGPAADVATFVDKWGAILDRVGKVDQSAWEALSEMEIAKVELPDLFLIGESNAVARALANPQREAIRRAIRVETGENVNLRFIFEK